METGKFLRKYSDVDVAFIQSVSSNDEYYAARNSGTFHNRQRILPNSGRSFGRLKTLGIECGDIDYAKKLISKFTKNDVYKLRLLGSAALGLCLVADGAFDGLVFAQPNGARTLDSVAGYLIAKEAGCFFANIAGNSEVSDYPVGFESKINMAVAKSRPTLRKLVQRVQAT
jgi:fructose-1,6-bisphosphatase/inositol monophosphatase family enzyme